MEERWWPPPGSYRFGGRTRNLPGETRRARSSNENTSRNFKLMWIGPSQFSTIWTKLSQKSGTIVSSQLTVTQTLELLDGLKATVRDFAGKEEKLNREFRTRTEATERRYQDEVEAHEARLATELSEADARFQTITKGLRLRAEKRKDRINKAHKSTKRNTLERLSDEE